MLQVYLDPCTVNSRKVLAGLDLLGTQYELKHIDYFAGAHKEPEYLAINPNGAVPAATSIIPRTLSNALTLTDGYCGKRQHGSRAAMSISSNMSSSRL
jgi:glutathione S-transferase-like protein